MKRSIKIAGKKLGSLIMVCALLATSYPMQTVASEQDTQQTTQTMQEETQSQEPQSQPQTQEQPNEEQQNQEPTSQETVIEEPTNEEPANEEPTNEEQVQEPTTEELTTEELTIEEPTTEEGTFEDVEAQIAGIHLDENDDDGDDDDAEAVINIDNLQAVIEEPVYQPGTDSSIGYFTATLKGSAVIQVQNLMEAQSFEAILKLTDAAGGQTAVARQEVELSSKESTKTVELSNSYDMRNTGTYTLTLEVWALSSSMDTHKETSTSIQVQMPNPLSVQVESIDMTVGSCEPVLNQENKYVSYQIPTTTQVKLSMAGLESSSVSAEQRRTEIRQVLAQFEKVKLICNGSAREISLAQDSLVDQLVQANGAAVTYTIEETIVVAAGEYSLQASINGKESQTQNISLEKLEQNAVYAPEEAKEQYYFSESVTYKLTEGISIGVSAFYESDVEGNKVSNGLNIVWDGGICYKISMSNDAQEERVNRFFTIENFGNSMYQPYKLTYPVTFVRQTAAINYQANPAKELYAYQETILFELPSDIKTELITCTQTDAQGQPTEELTITKEKHRIKVVNKNTKSTDTSTVTIHFAYAGNNIYTTEEADVTLKFAKLDNPINYTASSTQTTHEYGETITYTWNSGAKTEDIVCYESDADGNEITTDKHLEIKSQNGTFQVTGKALAEESEPFYVTIEHKENEVYRKGSQTFAFAVKKIHLNGEIKVNEQETGFFFFKSKSMCVTITVEASKQNLTQEDAKKISFDLSYAETGTSASKPMSGTRSFEWNSSTGVATYTYTIDKDVSKNMQHDKEYSITAAANYSSIQAPVYFEAYSKVFGGVSVQQSALDIQVQDTLEVDYNLGSNKLNYKILGEQIEDTEEFPVACHITVEDPTILSIEDDGTFTTLKGGTTVVTLVADDEAAEDADQVYDIYATCTKQVTITVQSPKNIDYTLNGKDPQEFRDNPDVKIGTENWYKTEIGFAFGEQNLYGEICYSTDHGQTWNYISQREFTITESMPTDYLFFFCDRDKNLSSYDIETGVGALQSLYGIGVDTMAPAWNDALTTDLTPSKYSTDSISYFAEDVTLKGSAGKQQVDTGTGVKKIYVQYGNSGEWEELKVMEADRYSQSFTHTLAENKVYGSVKWIAEDYLGHQSPVAEYGKSICVDKVIPVVSAVTIDAEGQITSYDGSWTNQQLRYQLQLETGKQVSGIHSYQYTYIPTGSSQKLSQAKWTQVSAQELQIVFGTAMNTVQTTIPGTLNYSSLFGKTKASAVSELEEYAQMNGTLYFRAESNAALVTQTADIEKNSDRVRIWQQDYEQANVTASGKADTTGWYNMSTGAVNLSFVYPEYDSKNVAPAVGIVYTLSVTDENDNTSERTRSFYKGIIDEETGEVIEVTNYHDPSTLTSLEKDALITISDDSINHLSVYIEDAAGNRSPITTYEIKADFHAPDQISAAAGGEALDIHLANTEAITYRKFSQNSLQVSAEAKYGISQKQSLYMALVKNQGETNNSQGTTDSMNIEPSTRGLVYVCAVDQAGNRTEAWTDGIVVDNMAPTGSSTQDITITPTGSNEADFYNDDISLSLHVVDAPTQDNYAGLKRVTYTVGRDNQVTQADITLYDNGANAFSWDQIVSSRSFDEERLIINAAQNESNHAYITVTATDNAGNVTTTTQEFQIDVTKPEIAVSFDINAAQNGTYYHTNRVARIDINELNFDAAQVRFRIYKDGVEDTTLTPNSWTETAENVHTAYINFAEDGDYSFEVECTDLAGNEADLVTAEGFTIDMTNPTVAVAYDNNQAWKENYYNQARTATITITEHNFDAKDFEAAIAPQAAVGGWTHDGDVHRVTISFQQDEHYTYSIDYVDLAGNRIDAFTPEEFYIDSNSPTIEIAGVEDQSANAGDVNPTVTVADTNYDIEGVNISLQNSKGEQIEVTRSQAGRETGYTYALTNVNELPDEIYTLSVLATDKAGNESELAYRFSLNRHGSVYDLSQISALVERTYIRYEDLGDLHIQEMNVNRVEEFDVYVTRNGEMIASSQTNGRPSDSDSSTVYVGTQVSGSDEIGYSYDYTLYKESFQQEGIYNIMFYSKDIAGNEVNNTLGEKEAELTFIVDNTVPTVVIEGINDGELYTVESKDVNVYVSDNFKLKEAYFSLVDEDGNIVQVYNYMELAAEEGDIVTLTLPSSDKRQTLQYSATDAAGNSAVTIQEEVAATGFFITTNTWIRYINNKTAVAGTAAATVMAAGAGVGITYRRRKRKSLPA